MDEVVRMPRKNISWNFGHVEKDCHAVRRQDSGFRQNKTLPVSGDSRQGHCHSIFMSSFLCKDVHSVPALVDGHGHDGFYGDVIDFAPVSFAVKIIFHLA